MDITTLRYFIELAHAQNMTVASKRLHISQPALSKQLKGLENELGHSLFKRRLHRLELTPAGENLLKRAEEIVALANTTIAEFRGSNKTIKSDLKIAISTSCINSEMSVFLNNFKKSYPMINLKVYSSGIESTRQLLLNKDVDCALLFKHYFLEDVETVDTNIKLPIGLLCRQTDNLANKNCIRYEDLASLKLIIPTNHNKYKILKQLNAVQENLNVVAYYDNPVDYIGILSHTDSYMICLAPQYDYYKEMGLCFRPLEPRTEANVCLVRCKQVESNEAVDELFTYFKAWFGI